MKNQRLLICCFLLFSTAVWGQDQYVSVQGGVTRFRDSWVLGANYGLKYEVELQKYLSIGLELNRASGFAAGGNNSYFVEFNNAVDLELGLIPINTDRYKLKLFPQIGYSSFKSFSDFQKININNQDYGITPYFESGRTNSYGFGVENVNKFKKIGFSFGGEFQRYRDLTTTNYKIGIVATFKKRNR